MHRPVTRLKPRVASYEASVVSFLRGDFAVCIDELSASGSLAAVALRARALVRSGRSADALASLHEVVVEDIPHAYAAELLIAKAAALHALEDVTYEFVLTEARARVFSSGSRPLECEVEYFSAFAAWCDGNIDEADSAIARVLAVSDAPPTFGGEQRADYLYSAAFWRSRAYVLRGLLFAASEDYAAQADSIMHAFREYDGSLARDLYHGANMLMNLAYLVRDIDSLALADFVEARAELEDWSGSFKREEFVIFHSIGLSRARRGDHLGALRSFRRSAACAPTIPLQIKAVLDRSFLSRELGEALSAQDDLEHAVRLSKQVDWEHSSGEERSALYELARALAPVNAKNARLLWNRFSALKSGVSKTHLSGRGDRRQRADECSAHAAVLVAEGQTARAASLLIESLGIWSEIGYLWRAAIVSLDLAELTGELRYLESAALEAVKQPNSWLARRTSSLKAAYTV